MRDPFPIPPPKALVKLVQPVAERLSLNTLPLHFHELVLAATLYQVTNKYISPALSRYFFPRIYPNFNARTKLNWDVHVVSFVQSTVINTLALWVIFKDEERAAMNWEEKIWGYTGASGLVQAFAGGYFVWDLFITLQNINIFGPGMLAHAVSALFVFSLGFRPFLNYYGSTFILYELSSPFLNIHWFCDKLNLTGTKIQLYNGILLLLTFFSCRLMWGSYQSIRVFGDVYRAITAGNGTLHDPKVGTYSNSTILPYEASTRPEIMQFATEPVVPVWLAVCYLASNIVLNGLNWFWFGKMIETIRKRFDPPLGTRKAEKKTENEDVLVEGINVTSQPVTPVPETVTGTDYIASVRLEKDAHTLNVQQSEVKSRSTRKGSDQAVAA